MKLAPIPFKKARIKAYQNLKSCRFEMEEFEGGLLFHLHLFDYYQRNAKSRDIYFIENAKIIKGVKYQARFDSLFCFINTINKKRRVSPP